MGYNERGFGIFQAIFEYNLTSLTDLELKYKLFKEFWEDPKQYKIGELKANCGF